MAIRTVLYWLRLWARLILFLGIFNFCYIKRHTVRFTLMTACCRLLCAARSMHLDQQTVPLQTGGKAAQSRGQLAQPQIARGSTPPQLPQLP